VYPFYLAADLEGVLIKQAIVIFSGAQLAVIYLRIAMPNYYSIGVGKWAIGLDAYVLVFGLAGNMNAFLAGEVVGGMGFWYS
jgi:hypothetical protein